MNNDELRNFKNELNTGKLDNDFNDCCGKSIYGEQQKTKVEIYESSEVVDKIKKSGKHFFEYFIGLW